MKVKINVNFENIVKLTYLQDWDDFDFVDDKHLDFGKSLDHLPMN